MSPKNISAVQTGPTLVAAIDVIDEHIDALAAIRRGHSPTREFSSFRFNLDDASNALAAARRALEEAHNEHAAAMSSLV